MNFPARSGQSADLLRSVLRRATSVGAALLALALGASQAPAVVQSFTPAKDNTIYSEDATRSHGAGTGVILGKNNRGQQGQIRRGLVMFDLASIPSNAVVTNVSLTMQLTRLRSGTTNVTLHRLTSSWGEGASVGTGEGGQGGTATTGDATWSNRFHPSTPWTTTGGDFVATASATVSVPGLGPYAFSGAGMLADVQAWVNNPATNNGWMIRGDEGPKGTARRFASREFATVAQRPTLTVTYTVNATTGGCCLPGDNCAVLSAADCATQGGTYQGDGTTCTPNPCLPPTGACCLDNGTCDTRTAAQCTAAGGTYQGDNSTCSPGLCPVVLEPFVDALPLPGVATPVSGTPGGAASYEIGITEFTQQLHRDLPPTRVWGYNGSYPGPTIEATRDQPVTVTWINNLRDSLGVLRTEHILPVDLCMHGPDSTGPTARTVVHLHGGHVPAESDGYPEHTILPGEQQTFLYPNNQQAAPLWYHDHALGITRLNVMMGLAGFYLLRDPVESALDLPAGEFEVPLALQDRTFNPDGSLSYPEMWHEHFFGDKILVNGKVWPYLNVKQGKYRFRLLGGANSRTFRLHLSNGLPFWVIGNEGGLLPAPVRRDTVTVAPGERYDVVVDFGGQPAGTEVLLVNSAPAPFPGSPGQGVIPDVMKFVVQAGAGHGSPLPASLRPIERLQEADAVQDRLLVLAKMAEPCAGSMWMINDLGWDDITEYPVLGTTEIWRFANRSGFMHPMHMHLVSFQVLDRQQFQVVADTIQLVGEPVPPDSSEAGWKDTVPVGPNEVVRVIARFEDYTGRYPYHCHILEHEDHEMMRQFEVVPPVSILPGGPGRSGVALGPSVPNPTRGRARFDFTLPRAGTVRLEVENVAGRKVAVLLDGELAAGRHFVTWDGRDGDGARVRPGVYFYRVALDGEPPAARKMVVIQ